MIALEIKVGLLVFPGMVHSLLFSIGAILKTTGDQALPSGHFQHLARASNVKGSRHCCCLLLGEAFVLAHVDGVDHAV